jgi:hypothetical protein
MLGEFLRKLAFALERTGVPYMLTGSLASSLYGVPRATNDIDFVVAPTVTSQATCGPHCKLWT